MNMDIDIFRLTATRALEPEAGASIIVKRRQLQRAATKPKWMPRWAFAICMLSMMVISGALAGRANSRS
jgi:hypothetical protein